MPKVLIVYYSRSGNTEKMAQLVAKGVKKTEVEVETKKVNELNVDELLKVEGVILGSPTYFGVMAAEMKQFVDKSIKYFGKLGGKVGGAFATSGGIGGGNETTIFSMIEALLIHGMIIQGTTKGGHYGPVAIGAPDKRVEEECIALGERVGALVKKLF
ncbi:MAG: NAD(P)H-dependent oxidoreductase [Pseudomonadota bacterium]